MNPSDEAPANTKRSLRIRLRKSSKSTEAPSVNTNSEAPEYEEAKPDLSSDNEKEKTTKNNNDKTSAVEEKKSGSKEAKEVATLDASLLATTETLDEPEESASASSSPAVASRKRKTSADNGDATGDDALKADEDELGILLADETLGTPEMDSDGELHSTNEPMGTLAKLPEDSKALRHESWKKLSEVDDMDDGLAKKREAASKAAKQALQKATAVFSKSRVAARSQRKEVPAPSHSPKVKPKDTGGRPRKASPALHVKSSAAVRTNPGAVAAVTVSQTSKSPPRPLPTNQRASAAPLKPMAAAKQASSRLQLAALPNLRVPQTLLPSRQLLAILPPAQPSRGQMVPVQAVAMGAPSPRVRVHLPQMPMRPPPAPVSTLPAAVAMMASKQKQVPPTQVPAPTKSPPVPSGKLPAIASPVLARPLRGVPTATVASPQPPQPFRGYSAPVLVPQVRPLRAAKEDIQNAIPPNASCIVHVMDRRVNLDACAPDVSKYALLRSWVQDDPYRQMPPPGSNILERLSRPSEKRGIEVVPDFVASERKKKRRKNVNKPCNVLSFVRRNQGSNDSVTSLRKELVEKTRQLKRKKQREDKEWMKASRANLQSIGIDLPVT